MAKADDFSIKVDMSVKYSYRMEQVARALHSNNVTKIQWWSLITLFIVINFEIFYIFFIFEYCFIE